MNIKMRLALSHQVCGSCGSYRTVGHHLPQDSCNATLKGVLTVETVCTVLGIADIIRPSADCLRAAAIGFLAEHLPQVGVSAVCTRRLSLCNAGTIRTRCVKDKR